ncbi:MAG: ABC transporter ATP-binding protein [Planctomycetes bacterium]|nr:ABC transporter ATP-binding protein [Planctomycetota bacterium]
MIEVRGLSKTYDEIEAVRNIEFNVEAGEIFGFIGPNGAGKTTTIRILATLLLPSAGSARICGHDVVKSPEEVRKVMGYMPDHWGVYPDLRVREYLDFFAASYGIPRRERARAVGDVMELTDLGELSNRLAGALSKGMRQRLCLAKTLIHDPQLLILDEPADGLDPRARIELRELLRELARMGKTVLISSHILTELSDLVTSVGIVEQGELLMSGPVEEIVARLSGPRFHLRTTAATLGRALEILLAQPGVEAHLLESEELEFSFHGQEEAVASYVRALAVGGVEVLGLERLRADLETVFMAVTRGRVQ